MSRFKRFGIVVLAAVAALALAAALTGCGSKPLDAPVTTPSVSTNASSTPAATHALISITDTGFKPDTVTVAAGANVAWTNKGTKAHSITIEGAGVDSGKIKPGKSVIHQFGTAGTFTYHDGLNASLTGTVIVK